MGEKIYRKSPAVNSYIEPKPVQRVWDAFKEKEEKALVLVLRQLRSQPVAHPLAKIEQANLKGNMGGRIVRTWEGKSKKFKKFNRWYRSAKYSIRQLDSYAKINKGVEEQKAKANTVAMKPIRRLVEENVEVHTKKAVPFEPKTEMPRQAKAA